MRIYCFERKFISRHTAIPMAMCVCVCVCVSVSVSVSVSLCERERDRLKCIHISHLDLGRCLFLILDRHVYTHV